MSAQETRKRVRELTRQLLDLHFRANDSLATEEEKVTDRSGFWLTLEELRGELEQLGRTL